ncbi:amidohydrolase [Jatrophihabitans sp. YIM 134969]
MTTTLGTAGPVTVWAERAHAWTSRHTDDLVAWRRDLHAHPELGFAEHRTTAGVVERLRAAGLVPAVLPGGTGVVCDVGPEGAARTVCLRADIDALPMADAKDVPYRSQHEGLCHACGHDAHTAVLLGVAAVLAGAEAELPGRIRLLFQPAEEQTPGGAIAAVAAGALDGVDQAYALHCDPRLAVGKVGLREGPITAAADSVTVTVTGPGGHTSRPQLTADVVYALGAVVTELPSLLSRRVDPRAGLSLVWGAVEAGRAGNAIPRIGTLRGTLRVLDRAAWHGAEQLVTDLVTQAVAPTGCEVEVRYEHGVPPVVNAAACVDRQREGAIAALGAEAVSPTAQSLGGEDFGWIAERVPSALARLGVMSAEVSGGDLHQPTFDLDERALGVGVRFTVATAVAALTAS